MVLGSLIASIALDTNEGPDVNDQYWANIMRDSFTCNPRFSGTESASSIVLNGTFLDGFVCCSTIYPVVERTSFILIVVEFYQEFVLVHLHFIMCGTVMVMAVIFILVKLRQLYATRDFISQMRHKGVPHRELDTGTRMAEITFNQQKRDRYCRMVGLAFSCTVLLLFNVVYGLPPPLWTLPHCSNQSLLFWHSFRDIVCDFL
jgi:hypothetical protein